MRGIIFLLGKKREVNEQNPYLDNLRINELTSTVTLYDEQHVSD